MTLTQRDRTVEAGRLAAVRRYDILDTPPDGAFDRIATLAARWFDVPVATVSIVDEDRIWFKATHGLDGVTQIGRDPGLCASAILGDEVHVINDAASDPQSRDNPLVTGELGVRFYAGAPIVTTDGHRLGTVNVFDTRPREIDEAGMATLNDLAAIVMDQLELRLSALRTLRSERRLRERVERDRADLEDFARTLQRTLVPPTLPAIDGLELASQYRTASPRQVGGDFYDVFALPGDRWAVVLGDVCGKGAPAASLTSFVRYTVRSLALHHDDPTEVLAELNAALIAEQVGDERPLFCTVVLAILTPEPGTGWRATVASGGHPPAWRVAADSRVEPLETPGGTLLGLLPTATFATHRTTLAPGDALVFHTDGLTEATTAAGTLFGEEGLRSFLPGCAGLGAAALIEKATVVLDELGDDRTDDVAILAVTVSRSGTGFEEVRERA
ncbi:sigma-B regulation protein RsbU (phosphoserine phosphatase) [Amycolatopsis arida]|uniref:Sigma-B regulation protein RsbU (Phosphoserine phosphatase) n=1 Tax=Amycolatopsis arida TaxID=587909 RepID=A0A1I5LU13_9PSEU|nr:GAF domain-containing SpoIIE family protein phosphatase [Amycolatopsis arida]TDX93845.1 sigma-B regulation protein RsbU (phosphoserine phosphatase) [Amycolatopsis arida]SFP00745.1 sigma-B regulation protein RsbU (phosphoserine phosphatase) [Amycolatopsis arida]